MKIKIQLIVLLLCIGATSYGQALQTIKTYHDPFSRTQLCEVYTVKSGTGIKHGSYKAYFQSGFLAQQGQYTNNIQTGKWVTYRFVENQKRSEITFDKEGKRIADIYYYENGNKESSLDLDGTKMNWNYDGIKTFEEKKDKTTGVHTITKWDNNGNKYHENITIGQESTTTDWSNNKMIYKEEVGLDKMVKTYYYFNSGKVKIQEEYKVDDYKRPLLSAKRYTESGVVQREISAVDNNKYRIVEYDETSSNKTIEYELNSAQSISQNTMLFLPIKYEVKIKHLNSKDNGREYEQFISDKGSVEKTIYYPNGKMKERMTTNENNRIRKEWYTDDESFEKVEDYDGCVYHYKNKQLALKTYPAEKSYVGNREIEFRSYEQYDENGQLVVKGKNDLQGKKLEYVMYEDGIKVQEMMPFSKDIYRYYPNGKIKEYLRGSSLYGYDENYQTIYIVDWKEKSYVEFYSNGAVKSKGYFNENGEEIGVWFHYTEKKKLIVKENGVERKPTKEEKNNHQNFLFKEVLKKDKEEKLGLITTE